MAASLLVMQRLAPEMPVCNATWNLIAGYSVKSYRALYRLTNIAEDGRCVLVAVAPDDRVQEEVQVAHERPADVEKGTDVASAPLRRARKYHQDSNYCCEDRERVVVHGQFGQRANRAVVRKLWAH